MEFHNTDHPGPDVGKSERPSEHPLDGEAKARAPGGDGRMLGALAALSLTAAFLALQRSKRSPGNHDGDARGALAAYLRDHLAGADAAIHIVGRLSDAYQGHVEGALFESLHAQFTEDRGVVEGMLATLGYQSRSAKRLAGRAAASVLRTVAGGNPGDLSLFRTLEALAIGVQGKRCLWRAGQTLTALPRPPGRRSFVELEADAVRQWDAIERHRRSLVPRTFGVA